MSARSPTWRALSPAAGLAEMRPALTAALSAEDKNPCLFAMVLPDAPLFVMACIDPASVVPRDNARRVAIHPEEGTMSFFAIGPVVVKSRFPASPVRCPMWRSSHSSTVMMDDSGTARTASSALAALELAGQLLELRRRRHVLDEVEVCLPVEPIEDLE